MFRSYNRSQHPLADGVHRFYRVQSPIISDSKPELEHHKNSTHPPVDKMGLLDGILNKVDRWLSFGVVGGRPSGPPIRSGRQMNYANNRYHQYPRRGAGMQHNRIRRSEPIYGGGGGGSYIYGAGGFTPGLESVGSYHHHHGSSHLGGGDYHGGGSNNHGGGSARAATSRAATTRVATRHGGVTRGGTTRGGDHGYDHDGGSRCGGGGGRCGGH